MAGKVVGGIAGLAAVVAVFAVASKNKDKHDSQRWKCNKETRICESKVCDPEDAACLAEYPFTDREKCRSACVTTKRCKCTGYPTYECTCTDCFANDDQCLKDYPLTPDKCQNECKAEMTTRWNCSGVPDYKCTQTSCDVNDSGCLRDNPYMTQGECNSECQPEVLNRWQCSGYPDYSCTLVQCSADDKECIASTVRDRSDCDKKCAPTLVDRFKCIPGEGCVTAKCDKFDSQCLTEYPYDSSKKCMSQCELTRYKCDKVSGTCGAITCKEDDASCIDDTHKDADMCQSNCAPQRYKCNIKRTWGFGYSNTVTPSDTCNPDTDPTCFKTREQCTTECANGNLDKTAVRRKCIGGTCVAHTCHNLDGSCMRTTSNCTTNTQCGRSHPTGPDGPLLAAAVVYRSIPKCLQSSYHTR